jgi:hypothetical protein
MFFVVSHFCYVSDIFSIIFFADFGADKGREFFTRIVLEALLYISFVIVINSP